MTETTETKLALMEQRVTSIVDLCDKMSSAIEKFGNIAAELQSVSALNNLKIDTQKKFGEDLSRTVEQQREEFHTALDEFNSDLSEKINTTETRIMSALDEMKKTLANNTKEQQEINGRLDRRVSSIEKWRYTLVGAAIIVGGFLAYLIPTLIEKLFGVIK